MDDWQPVATDDWQPVRAAKSREYQSSILPWSRDASGKIVLAMPSILKPAEQAGQSIYDTKPANSISDSEVGPLTAGGALQGAALLSPMAPGPKGAILGAASAPKVRPTTIAETKTAARDIYQNPENLNTPIPSESVRDIATGALESSAKDHPQVLKIAQEMENAALGGPVPGFPRGISAGQLDSWSTRLGELAGETQIGPNNTVTPTAKAAAAARLKPQIDELLSKNVPEWNTADKNWNAFRTAEGLDKKSNIAQIRSEGGGASYADRLKTNATQMLTNPNLGKFLNPEQQALLKKISTGTLPEKMLTGMADVFGNRIKVGVGTAGGFMAGGIPGALAGKVLDTAISKSIIGVRNSVANRRAQKLIASVLASSPYAQSLPPTAVRSRSSLAKALLASQQPLSANLIPSYSSGNK